MVRVCGPVVDLRSAVQIGRRPILIGLYCLVFYDHVTINSLTHLYTACSPALRPRPPPACPPLPNLCLPLPNLCLSLPLSPHTLVASAAGGSGRRGLGAPSAAVGLLSAGGGERERGRRPIARRGRLIRLINNRSIMRGCR